MRLIPAATAAPLLVLLLTWLSFRAINTEAEMFDRALAALDEFATVENALQRDVLTARAGMLRNYDPLVQKADRLNDALVRLRAAVAGDTETATAVDRLAASTRRQEMLIESFKSDNALLQNSLAYFGLFSIRLGASDNGGPLVPAVSALATAMLHLTLDTSSLAVRAVEDRLDEVARLRPVSTGPDAVQALVAHGRLLCRLLPATNGVLKALLAASGKEEQKAVRALVLTDQRASRETARRFRFFLYATSLLLLGFLIHLGMRLRRRTLALQRRAALEHVIAGISTRFINAQVPEIGAHVEQALAQLAECIGADRAYFMTSGTLTRVHGWCRKGEVFPPGWPNQAPALSTRFAPTAEGIILVPWVDRLPPSADRDALAAAGLRGWVCIASVGGQEIGGFLGFDVLRAGLSARAGELGLLRMALDAFLNVVGRDFLERERGRLEARLQQTRRMETIGVLASGIAHNFNNIVGAILGYTEMVEAHVALDSQPGRKLSEIRRSGERARDLIDQILTFGRRRDVRSTPVNVKELVAEATSLLRASLPSRVELIVREAPEVATVFGEPEQLQQVILNLCNNAAHAMDEAGRIVIETEIKVLTQALSLTQGELEPGRYVRISVSDAGRGIDGTIMERIFEPFFTTRVAGNGLGLATVREIVREHGGAVKVWSTLGVGSRFEVWLPCVAAAEPMLDEEAPALPLGHGETVLVVDDERERLLRHEEVLAALGYEPVGFLRAADALAECRAAPERFDALVVGHVVAPRAIDLAAELNRVALDLPIVLATASADEIGARKLAAAGISEVVRRPLVASEIAAALMRCLARPGSRWARYRRNIFPDTEIIQ